MTSSGIGKGKGRRKIKIEKIENKSNLIVTFSKRKGGLFRKAHELSILTEAEIAIILFSPGGKPYSFGHPAIEDVVDRFVIGSSIPLTSRQRITQAERDDRVVENNKKLAKIKEMIDFERKRKESLNTISNHYWGGINLEEQNLSIIQESIVVLKTTKAKVEREIKVRDLAKQNYNEPFESYNQYGYRPLNCEHSLFGDRNNRGSNSFIDVAGGGNLLNTYEVSSFGQGNYGSGWSIYDALGPFRAGNGPFVDGSSSFVDGGNGDSLLNTNEFNSSGVEDFNGGECSNSWGSEWFGFMPPNKLGGRFYPQP